MKTIKQEQEYIVQRGFLRRIKEAMDSGHYPDMERGKMLVEKLETQMKVFEKKEKDEIS